MVEILMLCKATYLFLIIYFHFHRSTVSVPQVWLSSR